MDRPRLRLAVQLLTKAESTDADAEAAALAERAYRLLADVITEHDQQRGGAIFGPRRRERRFLRDRRADRRSHDNKPPAAPGGTPEAAASDAGAGYRHGTEQADSGGRTIDFRL